jgi:carbon starvation protein CstA
VRRLAFARTWLFSFSVGALSATTRHTRGDIADAMRLMQPPLPAASRPSKMTATFVPFALMLSCILTSSICS